MSPPVRNNRAKAFLKSYLRTRHSVARDFLAGKGQLISKGLLKFSLAPKNEQKYALAYKKRSNQKSSTYKRVKIKSSN